MGKKKEDKAAIVDEPMTPVPLDQRQSWVTPAVIFGGLEFCVPILMIGATLIGAFGIKGMVPVVLFTFLILTWGGNTLSGYIGAKTGLSSSVIARQGFGDKQAKFIIALVIGVISMGWWAIQTSVTGNALCVILGIDYTTNRIAWAIVTIIVGFLFASAVYYRIFFHEMDGLSRSSLRIAVMRGRYLSGTEKCGLVQHYELSGQREIFLLRQVLRCCWA